MSEKSKKWILIFSICLNIGFLVITAYAIYQKSSRPFNHRRFSSYNSSAVFETINLDQRQKEEVDQLIELFRANMLSVSKAVAPLKADLFIGMAKEQPISEQEAQAIIEQMNLIQNKRGKLIYQHMKALRQVLTEEQAQRVFKRFAEIQNKWSKKVKPTW